MSVTISRGWTTYAARTAVVHRGRASLRLRRLRAIKHGRYLVIFVVTGAKRTRVIRFIKRV